MSSISSSPRPLHSFKASTTWVTLYMPSLVASVRNNVGCFRNTTSVSRLRRNTSQKTSLIQFVMLANFYSLLILQIQLEDITNYSDKWHRGVLVSRYNFTRQASIVCIALTMFNLPSSHRKPQWTLNNEFPSQNFQNSFIVPSQITWSGLSQP